MTEPRRLDRRVHRCISKITAKLGLPILPKDFNYLDCETESPLDMIAGELGEKILVNPGLPMSEYKSDILTFMMFCLDHISANPSNPGNVEALKALYTFPEDYEQDNWKGKILTSKAFEDINKSERRIEQLAQEICELAQDNRDLYEKKVLGLTESQYDITSALSNLARRSKIYLLGKRGSGKTIFINYLLSAKNYIFVKNNVVWFRIDLTKGNFDLQDWMRWQMCHVLFKYYEDKYYRSGQKVSLDLTSSNTQLFKRISHYAEDPDFERNYTSKFEEFKNHTRIDLNVPEMPNAKKFKLLKSIAVHFYKGIWDYLTLDRKIGIVFVLDGLDRLGLSEEDKKEFTFKFQGIQKYVMTTNAEPAAYIITMRYESYYHKIRDLKTIYTQLLMQEVDPWAIFNKRLDYVRNGKAIPPRKLRDKGFAIQGKELDTLADLMELYLKYITIGLTRFVDEQETDDPAHGMRMLNRIFNRDRRKMFLALQANLRFFFQNLVVDFDDKILDALSEMYLGRLPSLFTRKYYLVIEGWMLDSHSYHLNRYEYDLSKDGRSIMSETAYGPDYLPSIYQHPRFDGFQNMSILTGTRILQFMKVHEILRRTMIIDFLVSHFKYDNRVINRFLSDMVQEGTLEVCRPITYTSNERLRMTDRGNFVLDRLLGNIEYINLAIQCAGFPKTLLNKAFFSFPSSKNRAEFTLWKVINTVNFLRLLKALEEDEREGFNRYANERKEAESYDNYGGGIFLVFDKYRPKLIDSLFRILENAARKGNEALITKLTEYFGG